MALDGITIANIVKEMRDALLGGRIAKIAQPEADELLLTVKAPSGQRRLYISASASLPLVYLTDENKPSPFTAPNFCMLLRKHIANGRIGLSCLESSIWMSLEISAVRNLSLRSWANTATSFSVMRMTGSSTVSSTCLPR